MDTKTNGNGRHGLSFRMVLDGGLIIAFIAGAGVLWTRVDNLEAALRTQAESSEVVEMRAQRGIDALNQITKNAAINAQQEREIDQIRERLDRLERR